MAFVQVNTTMLEATTSFAAGTPTVGSRRTFLRKAGSPTIPLLLQRNCRFRILYRCRSAITWMLLSCFGENGFWGMTRLLKSPYSEIFKKDWPNGSITIGVSFTEEH